jgi:lysozyme
MKLSRAGTELIASFEGFVATPYNDSADNATIGYGHLLHLGPVTPADRAKWGTLSRSTALALLADDAAGFEHAVSAAIRVSLGTIPAHAQTRFDALVSLAFNIGAGAFTGSSLVREINLKGAPRDWTPLEPHWLTWDHDGGQVVPGLLNRRRAEFAIFAPGVYPAV